MILATSLQVTISLAVALVILAEDAFWQPAFQYAGTPPNGFGYWGVGYLDPLVTRVTK